MQNNLGILIITCDRNLDILPFVQDTAGLFSAQGLSVVIAGEENLPDTGYIDIRTDTQKSFIERMQNGLNALVGFRYALVLLDDYYVYDDKLSSKLPLWLEQIEDNNLVSLRLSKLSRPMAKTRAGKKKTKIFKSLRPYDIDFHPTIWRASELDKLLSNRRGTAWELEPLFAKYLNSGDQEAGISRTLLKYDELVVQGRFIRGPFCRHCSQKYKGERPIMTRLQSAAFHAKKTIYHLTPRFVIKLVNKIRGEKSFSMYSDYDAR